MQKDHQETPKLKRTKDTTRRKVTSDRTSIFPTLSSSQLFLDTTQIGDLDCNKRELKLLYDQYLQSIMTEIILKKKAEEKEKVLVSKLATVAKECDQNEEKLHKLKTRERDLIHLSKIQNDIDAQIIDINKYTEGEQTKTLQGILSQLQNFLKPLDLLHCDNITLPDTPEEWEKMSETLKSCSATLKSIMDLIGSKKESYQSVNNSIKEFVNISSNINDSQKRLEKKLCDLQALVLKIGSLSLMVAN